MADGARIIQEAAERVTGLGEQYIDAVERLRELHQRLMAGRFHLGVLGQFKRGKSTLINALMGAEILPTSVVPLTAIPTWISHASTGLARIEYTGERAAEEFASDSPEQIRSVLTQYVTEPNNPHNRMGVARAQIFWPAPILRNSVVLIDTPGIGSTFEHNTETTRRFLPQCDACVFVTSADPPITQAELEFLNEIRGEVKYLFFMLNKADYLDVADREKSIAFLRQTLQEKLSFDSVTIFPVSAKDALRARTSNDTESWRQSGMDKVESYLMNFLSQNKSSVLEQAVRRKVGNLLADVIFRLRVQHRALELPVEELNARLTILDEKLRALQKEQVITMDMFAWEGRRTRELLAIEHEKLVPRIVTLLDYLLDQTLEEKVEVTSLDLTLRQSINCQIPAIFMAEFHNLAQVFSKQLEKISQTHESRLHELTGSIRKATAETFDLAYEPAESSDVGVKIIQPHWVEQRWEESFGPISPGMMDRFLPRSLRRRRIEKRFRRQIAALAVYNAGLLREKISDYVERALEQFRREFNQQIEAAVTATFKAVNEIRYKRKMESLSLARELKQLDEEILGMSQLKVQITEDGLPAATAERA